MPISLHQVATQVNTACSDLLATLRGVNKEEAIRKEQGARLAAIRKAAGYRSARSAATENQWPESTYRAHEAGMRTIGLDDAERYVRRFKLRGATATARYILFGADRVEPVQPANGPLTHVPLISWVNAGQLADAAEMPVEDVPLLAFSDLGRGNFFALKVNGDSMDRISPEDSIIIVNQADRTLVNGRFYVFSVRGQATYKRWHTNPDYLAPYSTNPSNEPIFLKSKRDIEVIGRVRRTVLDL